MADFILAIQNNKKLIPQITGAPGGKINLAVKGENGTFYIPFTDEEKYMIGPRIKYDGNIYAPKGDFIAVVTWQGFSSFIGYGIKSDFSSVQILNFTTYNNFKVRDSFKPYFYYSQQTGTYICVYEERGNSRMHFGVLNSDGSFSETLFAYPGSFQLYPETGYFFYDENKHKLCLLGAAYIGKQWFFSSVIFSFSIQNKKCTDFGFSYTILNNNGTSSINIGDFQLKRAILSSGNKRMCYSGVYYRNQSSENFSYLVPSSSAGGSVKSYDSPSYMEIKYFPEDVLEKFGERVYRNGLQTDNYKINTSRLFYDIGSNSLLGFDQTAPDVGFAAKKKDVNGNDYDRGDFVAYNLNTGDITLVFKRPEGSAVSNFTNIVGVGKIY